MPDALADLAAAYLIRGRPADIMHAVDAARRAIAARPGDSAAQFNYALALERAGLVEEAARAWQSYLAMDSTSAWAAEARAHLEADRRARPRQGAAWSGGRDRS